MHNIVALREMRKNPICKELSDICVVTQRSYRLGTTDRASNICGNFLESKVLPAFCCNAPNLRLEVGERVGVAAKGEETTGTEQLADEGQR